MNRLIITLAAIMLAACGHMSSKNIDHDGLQGRWMITEIHGQQTIGERPAWIEFNNERLAANAGCNSLMGKYQLTKQEIEFTQVAGTQMYCQETMEQEDKFLSILRNKLKLQYEGDTLYLLEEKKTVLTLQRS